MSSTTQSARFSARAAIVCSMVSKPSSSTSGLPSAASCSLKAIIICSGCVVCLTAQVLPARSSILAEVDAAVLEREHGVDRGGGRDDVVDLAGAFGGDVEGRRHVEGAGDEAGNDAAERHHLVLDLDAEALGDGLDQFRIIADDLAALVGELEGREGRVDGDDDRAARLDVVEGVGQCGADSEARGRGRPRRGSGQGVSCRHLLQGG